METLELALRSERARRDWSREELGRRAGVHVAVIADLETGRRTGSVATVVALLDALDLDADRWREVARAAGRAGTRRRTRYRRRR